MKIKFDTNVDFSGTYRVENGTLNVNVENGEVSIDYQPIATSGYLRVVDPNDDLLKENVSYKVYTSSTANVGDYEDDEEEGEDVYELDDDESDEIETMLNDIINEDPIKNSFEYDIAKKIGEYDKDGSITRLITSFLNKKTDVSTGVAEKITKLMTNMVDFLDDIKEELEEC